MSESIRLEDQDAVRDTRVADASQGRFWEKWRVVQPVDRHSNKSALMPPTAGELARLARKSGSINPDSVPAKEKEVPTRTLKRRLSPQERAELVARYSAGEDTPALSREYGISKCGLLHLLRKEGVTMRKQAITPGDAKRAARLYGSGLSITEVVHRIGYSYSTVRKSLHGSGVVMRPKGIKRRPT
jgi:hypothetical protein